MKEKREYKECYVAIIDLLGFKNAVKSKSCDEIARYYDEIFNKGIIFDEKTGEHIVSEKLIEMRVMSDTICFFIDSNITNALSGLIGICCYFQARLLNMNEPILSRGAIVKGNVYSKGDVLFGDGIVNAYLLEENVAKHPRIIMSKQMIDDAMEKSTEFGQRTMKIHSFRDEDQFMCVDSLLLLYNLSKDSQWERFEKYVTNLLDSEMNDSIRQKYLYIRRNIPRIKNRSDQIDKDFFNWEESDV